MTMYTKKMLEERFKISDNTVTKTLEACGLSTSQREYTEEEVENYFAVARQMLKNQKMTYKEITKLFEDRNASPNRRQEQEVSPQSGQAAGGEFLQVFHEETAKSLETMAEAVVSDLVKQMPKMIERSLGLAAHRGDIRKAFEENRKAFVEGYTPMPLPDSAPLGGTTEHMELPFNNDEWESENGKSVALEETVTDVVGEDGDFQDVETTPWEDEDE